MKRRGPRPELWISVSLRGQGDRRNHLRRLRRNLQGGFRVCGTLEAKSSKCIEGEREKLGQRLRGLSR